MTQQYISILICGNASSNAGWSDIAMYNSAGFSLPDSVYGGFDHLDKFYTVRTEQSSITTPDGKTIDTSKVVYTMVRNKVKSAGAVRAGRLKIGFSIPRGYALPLGVSPKQVLDEIEQAFFAECMTGPDAAGVYHFNEKIADPQGIVAVAEKYPLRPVAAPFRPMKPAGESGLLEAGSPEMIALAMADVQFPEFTQFSEIVIAESSQGSPLPRVSVAIGARQASFDVVQILNGVAVPGNQTITAHSGSVVIKPARKAPKYHVYQPVSISLETAATTPGVKIDRERELIEVTFKPQPETLTYTLREKTAGSRLTPDLIKAHPYSLLGGPDRKPIEVTNGTFTLTGNENEWFDKNEFSVKLPDEYANVPVKTVCSLSTLELTIELGKSPSRLTKPAQKPNQWQKYWYIPAIALLALGIFIFKPGGNDKKPDEAPIPDVEAPGHTDSRAKAKAKKKTRTDTIIEQSREIIETTGGIEVFDRLGEFQPYFDEIINYDIQDPFLETLKVYFLIYGELQAENYIEISNLINSSEAVINEEHINALREEASKERTVNGLKGPETTEPVENAETQSEEHEEEPTVEPSDKAPEPTPVPSAWDTTLKKLHK